MQRVRDEPTDLEHISRSLTSMGYTVRHCVLEAADFGSPTRRQRLFIAAFGVPGADNAQKSDGFSSFVSRVQIPQLSITKVLGPLEEFPTTQDRRAPNIIESRAWTWSRR
eukprot:9487678-Pyramimonas_sp.AAC.1